MSEDNSFFSREELLQGNPARQATTLLYAIETRTARLGLLEREAGFIFLSPKSAEEREKEFLAALATGREAVSPISIRDIENHAPDWQILVPERAEVCAAIANLLGKKYRFRYTDVTAVRIVLRLDTDEVKNAYERLYHRPITEIYLQELSFSERFKWVWASLSGKLEALPPFWITFLLTLPGSAGLLAMPIALARVGVSTGIAILMIFGVVNMLTVAALAEAVARSGTARFGLGFLGQLAHEYLGPAASTLMTIFLVFDNFLVLIIFYLGIAGTLQAATGIPTGLWVAVVFGVCLYFLYRRTFNATVGTTLLIVLVNLTIIILIPILVLPYFHRANLTGLQLPFVGISLDPGAWQLILGIMLSTYFSHIMIAAYAPVGLRRDPSGRSWLWGSIIAIFSMMVIAIFWMIAIAGAVSPANLAATAGTVLVPLVVLVGPVMRLLGSILVIFSLGLASIQISLVLYYSTDERLPAHAVQGRLRFLVNILPVIVGFLITEWVVFSGQGTFTGLLSLVSVLALPLLSGIFPVLLLSATRRKGDFTVDVLPRWIGSPAVVAILFLFSLASILVHGLFLWSDPFSRALAFLVCVLTVGATLLMVRQGAFRNRMVLEVCDDQSQKDASYFALKYAGRPFVAPICLSYAAQELEMQSARGNVESFQSLRSVVIEIPKVPAREVKIWVHRIMPDGSSKGIPVKVTLFEDIEAPAIPHEVPTGQWILPVSGAACRVEIGF